MRLWRCVTGCGRQIRVNTVYKFAVCRVVSDSIEQYKWYACSHYFLAPLRASLTQYHCWHPVARNRATAVRHAATATRHARMPCNTGLQARVAMAMSAAPGAARHATAAAVLESPSTATRTAATAGAARSQPSKHARCVDTAAAAATCVWWAR